MENNPKNRDRDQIMYEMLKAASGGGMFKSRIMSMAYLSYIQATSHLNALELLQMLKHEPDSKYYLTEKGQAFLSKYEALMKIFDVRQIQQT